MSGPCFHSRCAKLARLREHLHVTTTSNLLKHAYYRLNGLAAEWASVRAKPTARTRHAKAAMAARDASVRSLRVKADDAQRIVIVAFQRRLVV